MEFWLIILTFVTLWFTQLFLTKKQTQHYTKTLTELKQKHSGYLGVGLAQAKFKLGPGIVLIIVTDIDGIITDCRIMRGITVFAKFHKKPEFIGLTKEDAFISINNKYELKAFNQAFELICQEKSKEGNVKNFNGGI